MVKLLMLVGDYVEDYEVFNAALQTRQAEHLPRRRVPPPGALARPQSPAPALNAGAAAAWAATAPCALQVMVPFQALQMVGFQVRQPSRAG